MTSAGTYGKDGSRFWANGIMTALYDDRGQCVGLAKIVSDATQRKQMENALRQSEQRFRQAIEQLPLSTQIVAPDGRLLQVNHASEALLGLTVEELLLEWLPISCFEGDCERAPGKQDLSPGIYPAR